MIENSGQGSAHAVSLKPTPNFQRFAGKYIGDLGLFKHGIRHLAPRQRISFFLTSIMDAVHGQGDDLSRLDFVVEASYKSALGREYVETFPIYFESYEGFGTIGTPPLISIAQDIDRLQKDFAHFASGFRKLQVVVSTRRDIQRDEEEIMARYKEKKAPAPPDPPKESAPVPSNDR